MKATHEGTIEIGDITIPVAVLEDGTRVLTLGGFLTAIGRSRTPKSGTGVTVAKMPTFLAANNLKPFITSEIEVSTTPVKYTSVRGQKLWGYKAELLPQVCEVYLKADDTGQILPSQQGILERSKILIRGLARVGIIALVDEATGYQYHREKDELQKILKAYIAEELLPWQKRFPDVYYKELFRLNKWDFTVSGIKKRPGVIGTWTNKLIYEQLPPGVLEELKAKTPKSQSGNYTARFFQSLTPDVGNPHLTAQINQVVTLFQLSDTMKHMWQQFEKLKIRKSGQLELPFSFDKEGHTVEPIEESTLSGFNKSLKKALDYNPKEK